MKLNQIFKMHEVKTDSTKGKNKLIYIRATEVNIISSASSHNLQEKKMKNSDDGLSPPNWRL